MPESDRAGEGAVLALTAKIAASYVRARPMAAGDLPPLIAAIHETLTSLSRPRRHQAAPAPAVAIRRSVTPNHLICLEDGRKLKTLKRYLRIVYGLSPDEYRRKWHLPRDYPMVAPNYAALRARLAVQAGFGRIGRRAAAKARRQRAATAPAPEK